MTNKMTVHDMAMCGVFTAFITVGAYIHIPLPFGDYYTLQLLFVLLSGLLLGAKRGTIAAALYVGLGLVGLPVFAGGGGPGYVLNPSFGYLIGFIAGAWVAGMIIKHLQPVNLQHLLIACYAAMVIVYVFGLPYKYFILNFYMHTPITWALIFASCFPIDIPCDVVLCFCCACLVQKMYPAVSKLFKTATVK